MHLVGQFSNPLSSVQALFDALEQGPHGSSQQSRRPDEPLSPAKRLGNGEVQRAVIKVLAMADRPMRIAEVHRDVEDLLSISVSKDSVNSCLSAGAGGKDPRFVRTELGVYQLGIDVKTVLLAVGLIEKPRQA
jgi:hypothetical protein